MKRIFKNFCIIALLIVFSFSSLGFTSLNLSMELNANSEIINTEVSEMPAEERFIENILSKYRTKAADKTLGFDGWMYDDQYAGIWYDENQKLNVGVTEIETKTNPKVNYVLRQFSYNYLIELHSILVDLMNKYSIFGVGITPQYNQVAVSLTDGEEIDIITNYLIDLSILNEKSIEVINFTVDEIPQTHTRGGQNTNRFTGTGFSRGTITAKVICNQTGDIGFLTNDHVAPVGSVMRLGETQAFTGVNIGTSRRGNFGGSVDAAFVPYDNPNNWVFDSSASYWDDPLDINNLTTVPTTYQVASVSDIIVGSTVAKFGDTTGRTDGTIAAINQTINVNNNGTITTFTNQIRHTALSQAGDSGSPLFITNGNKFTLIGIHSSGDSISNHFANRITDVIEVLDITIVAPIDSTYSFITNKVFELLGEDDDIVSYLTNTSLSNHLTAKNALDFFVAEPEFKENIAGTHYYVAYNQTYSTVGRYYKNNNGNYSRSARTRLEDHYSTALNAYHNNDMDNAIKYLGYAIHYLIDMGTTVYTTGVTGAGAASYLDYLNKEFYNENKADFHTTSAGIDANYGVFSSSFKDRSVFMSTSSANGVVPNGTSFYNAINTVRTGADEITYYDPIIQWTLPATERYVAALLDQFYKDTVLAAQTPTHRSEALIKDGEKYFIKNLMSGFYVDVKGWGTASDTLVHQFSFSGDTNQMFVANYHDSTSDDGGGYFNFTPAHATSKRLSFNYGLFQTDGDCVLKNPTNSIYQRFKITYLEDGKYRVMTGASDYAKILRSASNASGSNAYDLRQLICELAFNPNSINHYWSFERIVDLSSSATSFTQGFKSNEFYRIAASSSGTRTFTSTNSSLNFFEIGYRTGTGNSTYTRTGNSTTSTQDFSASITSGRIYYLKVNNKDVILPASNTSLTSNIDIGLKDEIYVRLLPPSKRTYTFKSVNEIEFYNHAGTLIPVNYIYQSGKFIYTITLNVNDTIYVRYQKVSGTNYIDFEMTS